jgi:AraC-like DNA-binding protein
MRERRGPVLFRWFMSYLAILIIPFVFSAAVYFYSLRIINNSSEEIYRAALEQIRAEMDNYFSGVFQTLQQLALNDNIQALSLVKEKLTPRDQWNVVESIKELKKVQIISPLIDDIFVVLNPLDSVITTSAYMPQDLFYELYYENRVIGREGFKTLMKEPGRNEIRPVKDNLLLLQASTEGFLGDRSATLVIACGREKFDSRYFTAYESGGSRIFVADRENRIVYASSGRADEIPVLEGSAWHIGGTPYRVLSRDSRVMDWKYLYFIPESLAKSKARQIQVFTFAGLFICSLFCLFLSYRMTRRNYVPVRKLMDVFNRPGRMDRGEDEFDWMEKKARDTQNTLGNSLRIVRKYYVNTLLEKPFDPVTSPAEMERYGIRLEGEWNVAVLFVLPDFPSESGALSESDGDIINAIHYTIIHIFTEAAGNRFSVEMTDAGERVAAVINWSGGRDAFMPRLEEAVEYTQQETGEFLHVHVFTALGEPRQGLEGIYYSNLEARETLRYLDPKTGQSILRYRDIRYAGGKYRYSQETEQKFINFIRVGDAGAAQSLLRQVWAENVNSGVLPGKTIRLLAYNLLGSLVKGVEEDGVLGEGGGKPGFHYPDLESIPAGELLETLEKASAELCRCNSLARQNKREAQLSGKVKQYINENFRDPDINISITSLRFGMNPAYLSAVFKEETGLSLLEYINTLRIEEGKKLLAAGREVSDAAGQCGFHGSGTFIRVFKKLTGLTPGQYREMSAR